MEYTTSKQMLNNAEHLIKLYKAEKVKIKFTTRCSNKHRVADKRTLENMSIALTAMSMLMTEYDRQQMINMLQSEGLANKIIKAIDRVKIMTISIRGD